MQVSVETTSGLERRVTVGVPAEKVDVAVEGKLQEAQKTIRLDGFRPGKVPMREVKRRFGGAVRNEVLADVMREAFIEAVEQEKLQPAGMPGFEAKTNEAGKDLEFVATFEVYPEVELAAFDTCLLYTISEPTRLRRISYAVFCLKKKKKKKKTKKKKKKQQKQKKKQKTIETK